jgi:hypothetical protein
MRESQREKRKRRGKVAPYCCSSRVQDDEGTTAVVGWDVGSRERIKKQDLTPA